MEANQTIHKRKKPTKITNLNLCIIFPEALSPQAQASILLLDSIEDMKLYIRAVKAGYFSHRHKKHISDKRQCEIRQKYLDEVPDGEWLLVLDNDEMLFGALDRIPDLIAMAESNNIEWIGINELLPDGQFFVRPRLMKKKEGMQYGTVPNEKGVMHKHDMIGYEGRNYIDMENKTNSWLCDFIGFFHYKNGFALELYPMETTINMPENMIKLSDLEESYTVKYAHTPISKTELAELLSKPHPKAIMKEDLKGEKMSLKSFEPIRTAYTCIPCARLVYSDFETHDNHMAIMKKAREDIQ